MKNDQEKPAGKLNKKILTKIYAKLHELYGEREWWLDTGRFEIIIGAILVQNTSWKNADKALDNLRKHSLLTSQKLKNTDISIIRELIRPAGLYNIKLTRILNFLDFLRDKYDFSINKMAYEDTGKLRENLIKVKGIGRETADVILLYALGKEVFCIDNYTKRIFYRLGLVSKNIKYEEFKNIFENLLDKDINLYRKYHIFLDALGHYICKKNPECHKCPLNYICEYT